MRTSARKASSRPLITCGWPGNGSSISVRLGMADAMVASGFTGRRSVADDSVVWKSGERR